MAEKLHGLLNLSKIDKNLITTNAKGDKVLWIDVVPNRDGVDQYGNTHALTIYNKEARQTIYLGNLKPQEFGGSGQAQQSQAEANDDLPWD